MRVWKLESDLVWLQQLVLTIQLTNLGEMYDLASQKCHKMCMWSIMCWMFQHHYSWEPPDATLFFRDGQLWSKMNITQAWCGNTTLNILRWISKLSVNVYIHVLKRSIAVFTCFICAFHHICPVILFFLLPLLAPPPLAALQLCLLSSLGCCVTVISQPP